MFKSLNNNICEQAEVVKLADTYGSEPYALNRLEGSNPSFGTSKIRQLIYPTFNY